MNSDRHGFWAAKERKNAKDSFVIVNRSYVARNIRTVMLRSILCCEACV